MRDASVPAFPDGLRMPAPAMLDLAARAAEALVRRSEELGREEAWDGEFRGELVESLMEEPPEGGRAPEEVLERALADVLRGRFASTIPAASASCRRPPPGRE